MSLYNQIKSLYPNIPDSDFSLQCDDRINVYIKSWKSTDYPQPTQNMLNSVTAQQQQAAATQIAMSKKLILYRANPLYRVLLKQYREANPSTTIQDFINYVESLPNA